MTRIVDSGRRIYGQEKTSRKVVDCCLWLFGREACLRRRGCGVGRLDGPVVLRPWRSIIYADFGRTSCAACAGLRTLLYRTGSVVAMLRVWTRRAVLSRPGFAKRGKRAVNSPPFWPPGIIMPPSRVYNMQGGARSSRAIPLLLR